MQPCSTPSEPPGEPRRVLAALDAEAARLDAVHLDGRVVKELVEQAHGVRAAAHAGDEAVRQPALHFHDLLLRLAADDGLEVPHHHGERMGTVDRAEHVVRVRHVRDPVAHGLVDGVLERFAAAVHGPHGRAQELHAEHVQGLARHVVGAHVDLAVEAEHGRGRGRGHAVLARAGLGDHAGLAHALGEQDLGQGVVDLVRARVAEVLALQVDLRAAQVLGQPSSRNRAAWDGR